VADHQRVAVGLEQARAVVLQLGHQLVVEALARERHVAVLERIGHAPDPVVLLDQQVLALDQLARGRFLLLGKEILDDLEHVRKARQVEHQHHHALDAGCDAEAVARVLQVVQEVAVEAFLPCLARPRAL